MAQIPILQISNTPQPSPLCQKRRTYPFLNSGFPLHFSRLLGKQPQCNYSFSLLLLLPIEVAILSPD